MLTESEGVQFAVVLVLFFGGQMKKIFKACAFLALASGAANATVYTGAFSVDTASVTLSITTDGTIGALTMPDVTAWSFTIDNGGGAVTIDQTNSQFTYLSGTALQATATQLLFDFDGYGHMQFDNFAGAGNGAFCATASAAPITCTGNYSTEAVLGNGGISQTGESGLFVLGTAEEAAAVPEPASWAMMVCGFGLAGSALRRKKTLIKFA